MNNAQESIISNDFSSYHSSDPLIVMDNLEIGYNNNSILSEVNLSIDKGEYIGIIGPNGSGKTSFLKTLLGLISPLSGKILIQGDVPKKKEKSTIGYVPQSTQIDREFPLSVEEVVLQGLFGKIGLFRSPRKSDKEAAVKALHKVHMWKNRKRPIGHLSGGEQQKVMIARALVLDADVLLLDEPTSSLDFQMTKSLFDLVRELNEKYKQTVIMVHHNIDLIRHNCKRLLVFHRKIRYDGPPNTKEADRIINLAYNLSP